MFRSIQSRFAKRVETLKKKTETQYRLEKLIREFLIKEFGPIGESLGFSASLDGGKLHIRTQNKTASNEIVIRSKKLTDTLKSQDLKIEAISVS